MIKRWEEYEKERKKKIAELFSMADERAKTLGISKKEALKKIVDEKRTTLENLAMELGEEAYEKFLALKLEMERQEREGIYDEKREWFLLSRLEEELKKIEQEQIESGKRESKADALMSEIESLLTQAEQAECIEASKILGQKVWKLRPRVEQMSLSAVQQGRLSRIKSREKKIEAKIRKEGCLGPSYWYSGLGNFNKWLTIKIIEYISH